MSRWSLHAPAFGDDLEGHCAQGTDCLCSHVASNPLMHLSNYGGAHVLEAAGVVWSDLNELLGCKSEEKW